MMTNRISNELKDALFHESDAYGAAARYIETVLGRRKDRPSILNAKSNAIIEVARALRSLGKEATAEHIQWLKSLLVVREYEDDVREAAALAVASLREMEAVAFDLATGKCYDTNVAENSAVCRIADKLSQDYQRYSETATEGSESAFYMHISEIFYRGRTCPSIIVDYIN